MSSLGPGEIRARRRPFVILGVAFSRLFLGFCLALPLASLLAESGIGQRAEGDRALFEGGGYLLLEVLRLQGAALAATARGLLPLLVMGLLLTAACNAALLVALTTRGPLSSLAWLAHAAARLPAMCVLAIGTTLCQGLVLLVTATAADSVPSALAQAQRASWLGLGVWLLGAALAGALGGFADVTKAALVRHESPLTVALARAWKVLPQRPFFGLFGWLPYALPFGAAALGAAWLTETIDVSRPGEWRVAAVFALHQSVVVVAVACRAAWFARALRGACSLE